MNKKKILYQNDVIREFYINSIIYKFARIESMKIC